MSQFPHQINGGPPTPGAGPSSPLGAGVFFPLQSGEWWAIWTLIWGISLAHVAFWAWLFQDRLAEWFWWL